VESRPFRILSLDGGGIMGAFSASVLATFEKVTGRRIVEHFDLITGTSTGGIIAIGLAMGAGAQEICSFYEARGPQIFPAGGGMAGWTRLLRNLVRPKFTPEALREAIRQVVGDQALAKAKTRLVIPAYDTEMGRVYLFKTPHHPSYEYDRDLPAVDVALATSAAPTYFAAHHIAGRGTFIDGGVWANCPAMVGFVEAVDFLGQAPGQVRLLSISTTSYPFRIGQKQQFGGLLGWSTKIIETLMFGQAQAAIAEVRCLLRQGLFHRIDYVTEPRLYHLDNPACVQQLLAIGRSTAELNEHMSIVRKEFLNGEISEHIHYR
jgi:patatin-like phospholipase/acyl hydrolase